MTETDLQELPTTESGAIKKQDAMEWMDSLDPVEPEADTTDISNAVVPIPYNHEGSTFDEECSNLRVTGSPEWITEVARRFKFMLDFESVRTRLGLNLQQVEDRDTGELQDDVYALYLSVHNRG